MDLSKVYPQIDPENLRLLGKPITLNKLLVALIVDPLEMPDLIDSGELSKIDGRISTILATAQSRGVQQMLEVVSAWIAWQSNHPVPFDLMVIMRSSPRLGAWLALQMIDRQVDRHSNDPREDKESRYRKWIQQIASGEMTQADLAEMDAKKNSPMRLDDWSSPFVGAYFNVCDAIAALHRQAHLPLTTRIESMVSSSQGFDPKKKDAAFRAMRIEMAEDVLRYPYR